MKRTIALGVSALCAVALLAAAASPASAAPPGKGLVDFGIFTCEGIGDVTVIGPRGPKAAVAFTPTGQHLGLISLDITGTDFDGNPVDFSKTYGKKSALTPITCTQHFAEGQADIHATAVVGLVPPQ